MTAAESSKRAAGELSANIAYLEPSVTMAISQEAQRRKNAGEDIIDLSAGEPDFPTPKTASEAGIKAIQQGKTHYPPNAGILELRVAVARNLSMLSGGRPVNADNVVISSGAKQSLFNACFVLFGPGDRVLVPSPYWVSYPQMIRLARAEPVTVPGDVEWSLKVGVDDLEAASDGTTKGVIFSTPVNPTGAVYARSELKKIAEWARDRSIWLISDEIYRMIHFGEGPAPSVLDLPDDLLENVVVIYGASKAYAMTGWRVGTALAPNRIAKAMAAVQSHSTSGASHPAQWAAATAFSDSKVAADVVKMVEQFGRRRKLVVEYFRTHFQGTEFVEPLGAFYFFFRVDQFFSKKFDSAMGFCENLLAQQKVALVPGEAFGDGKWVRLSYAASEKSIVSALERLTQFVSSL
ncbi:MAG: pyridoxal phosphate-dependent aminotransferase [Gemmatimonadetes bacterium]|nr:pyridoxal phosphate-dependent aminotransferase [Gemmatimonadota bacterium]